jgi:hypothetical protein
MSAACSTTCDSGDRRHVVAPCSPGVVVQLDDDPDEQSKREVEAGGLTDEINDNLDRVDDGDVTAVHGVVATFETAFPEAVGVDDGGETLRDVFWPYYERVADTLADATQTADRSSSFDLVEAYDPTIEDEVSIATPAIANAVGRHVIRTRVIDGVEAIAVSPLTCVDDIALMRTK